MSELQAGTILVVHKQHNADGVNWVGPNHILYVVSDITHRKSLDLHQDGHFYWCIDILNPANGVITTWHRTVRKELIDDIMYFHTPIDGK